MFISAIFNLVILQVHLLYKYNYHTSMVVLDFTLVNLLMTVDLFYIHTQKYVKLSLCLGGNSFYLNK